MTKKISYKITFIRGDYPEYGELTQYIFASTREAAIAHVKHCYGAESKILNII